MSHNQGNETDGYLDRYFESLEDMEKYRKGLLPAESSWRSDLLVEFFNSGFDEDVLIRALLHSWASKTPPPTWVVHELVPILEQLRHKRPGKGYRSKAETEERFHVDINRAWAVWRLMRKGETTPGVWESAAQELESTPYEGSDSAMKQSWYRVKDYFPSLG